MNAVDDVPQLVATLRESMSDAEIAVAVNVNVVTVYRWAAKKATPHSKYLRRLRELVKERTTTVVSGRYSSARRAAR